MVASSGDTKKETHETRIRRNFSDLEVPLGEKEFLQYVSICYLPFANLTMEELILVHARYLVDIEDLIWESRDGEYVCHLGICSICQVVAFVLGFPKYLCKSPVQVWLAISRHYNIRASDYSTDSDDSSDLSSDSESEDIDEPLNNF